MRGAVLVVFVLVAIVTGACDRSTPRESAAASPRIVSVGGAVTETIFALGAGARVVGVDTSSVHPEETTRLPRVGYQRTLAAEGILALAPTIVIASAEAGPPSVLEQLRASGVRVEIMPAEPSADGARARITKIAALIERDPAPLVRTLDDELGRAAAKVAVARSKPRVLALYSRGANTTHVFGRNTPGENIVRLAGGENAMVGFDGTKPLTSEALVASAPDVILVPSRGLESLGGIDGLLRLPGVADTPAAKAKRIVAMDDVLLLGFGPRTGRAALDLFAELHPGEAP